MEGISMTKRTYRVTAAALVSAAILSISAPAFASPPPPTNGGNGGGSSGQCTGNPDGRPASCGP